MLEVLRSGQLSLGPRVPAFESAFAARVGAPSACAVSSGTAGLHLALRAAGVEDGDEVVTSPFSFVASANAAVYERARPVFADIDPGHPQPRPPGGGGRAERAHAGRCCRFTSSATRPPCRRSRSSPAGMACRSWRMPARRSARCTPTARRWAGAVIRPCSASTPTSSSPRARAAWSRWATPRMKERLDSERNQGRAPDMGWLDHDRLGFNYRLSDIACALGIAQLARLSEMLAARSRLAEHYRAALAGIEGLQLPCPDRGRRRPRMVRVRRAAPARAPIAMTPCARSRPRASRASPTCRRST